MTSLSMRASFGNRIDNFKPVLKKVSQAEREWFKEVEKTFRRNYNTVLKRVNASRSLSSTPGTPPFHRQGTNGGLRNLIVSINRQKKTITIGPRLLTSSPRQKSSIPVPALHEQGGRNTRIGRGNRYTFTLPARPYVGLTLRLTERQLTNIFAKSFR